MTQVAWRKALLTEHATVQEAIACLDHSAMQIVLVVTADDVLVGTVTDGDIRRGLLRGLDLSSPIMSVANRDPLVVPPQMGRDTVLQLMKANSLHHFPVVNEQKVVVDLILMSELLAMQLRANTMIIMAGGKGTRLGELTQQCPKPLLPVAGKPMLEHIIERARLDGIHRFILSVHYLGHMIEDYFGDGSRWNVRIDYLHEDEPLGTAGALSLLNMQPEQPVLVTNGDVLTDIRYGDVLDFHDRNLAHATMAVRQHEWQHQFGVVKTRGIDITGFEEKPVIKTHVNAGIYVLAPAALTALEKGRYCDMPSLFMRLHEQGQRIIAYPMHEPWLDVGRPDDLAKAQRDYS